MRSKIFVETVNVHKEDTMCFETVLFVYDVRKTCIRFKVYHRIRNTDIMNYRLSIFPSYRSFYDRLRCYGILRYGRKTNAETKRSINVGKDPKRTDEHLFAKCTNTVLERTVSQYLYSFSYFTSLSLPTYLFQFI